MTYRFASISPDDLLATTCPAPSCGQTTLHGLVSRLTWVWSVPGESVRPAVVCGNCLAAAGDVFAVETREEQDPPAGPMKVTGKSYTSVMEMVRDMASAEFADDLERHMLARELFGACKQAIVEIWRAREATGLLQLLEEAEWRLEAAIETAEEAGF